MAARSKFAGPEAGAHYKKIPALAEEAYPEHALSYMSEDGVHGLVNSIAAEP